MLYWPSWVRPSLSLKLLLGLVCYFFWNWTMCYGPLAFAWQSQFLWKKMLSGKNDWKWSQMTQKWDAVDFFLQNCFIGFDWNWCKIKVMMFQLPAKTTYLRIDISNHDHKHFWLKITKYFNKYIFIYILTFRVSLHSLSRNCFYIKISFLLIFPYS